MTVLELFFDDSWLLTGRKNIVKYSVFIVFVYGNYILQQSENCVNTSVFAWPRAKNTVNTVIFLARGKKNRKYRCFWLPQCKNPWYLQCFWLQGFQKYAKTPPNWRFLGSTKMRQYALLPPAITTRRKKKNNTKKKKKEEEEEEEDAPNFDKKMCGRMLTSCGMTRSSHCALRLRTSRAHDLHQRPHYYT